MVTPETEDSKFMTMELTHYWRRCFVKTDSWQLQMFISDERKETMKFWNLFDLQFSIVWKDFQHANSYGVTHCCIQTLQTEIQMLKDQVQEVHRDLTKHHSLIKTDTMNEILEKSVHVDRDISTEASSVEKMRAMFEEVRK